MKKIVEYILCGECNQKFEPVYLESRNECMCKIEFCPTCRKQVNFQTSCGQEFEGVQKIQIFEYENDSEVKEFGIILKSQSVMTQEELDAQFNLKTK